MVSGSISLPCSGYFSPFPHGTCSLSVSLEYLALPDGPGRFRQDFTCPALLRILLGIKFVSYTGLSPSLVVFFQKHSITNLKSILQSYNPINAETYMVWAIPISLAATLGITIVFFSSGYLDVSVHQVSLLKKDNYSSNNRVAPFGNFRLEGYLHLFGTFRSLSRPS